MFGGNGGGGNMSKNPLDIFRSQIGQQFDLDANMSNNEWRAASKSSKSKIKKKLYKEFDYKKILSQITFKTTGDLLKKKKIYIHLYKQIKNLLCSI